MALLTPCFQVSDLQNNEKIDLLFLASGFMVVCYGILGNVIYPLPNRLCLTVTFQRGDSFQVSYNGIM